MSEENAASTSGGSGRNVLPKKCFQDPVHGPIELHPLLVKIIDTPQFQRLRNIKQLGATYFVYPGASHNRFEHCIGTCHLAGELARHLQAQHPELIDDKDILCVEIAGLCHDLGHGPFSHLFDNKFLPRVGITKLKHEEVSCKMFDHLMETNQHLEGHFTDADLNMDEDLDFIKEIITGPLNDEKSSWNYRGRPREKGFLYEIVSNGPYKVDVDKWDYFARDSYHLGIKNSFDHKRFMKFLKVLKVGEDTHICQRDKEYLNLYEMFHVRSSLHRRAYQHRVCSAIDAMICDALVVANKHICFPGKDGKMLMISETITDMVAFEKLTDNVLLQILHADNRCDFMVEAQHILNRILRRDLYDYVGHSKLRAIASEAIPKCFEAEAEIAGLDQNKELKKDDIVVNVRSFDFCMGKENPLDHFMFYNKDKPDTAFQIPTDEISDMLPQTFQDHEIQVFSKDPKKSGKIKECFQRWCRHKGYPGPLKRRNLAH
ncbi:deoxynucleoside triphosphate triphosphohydrolase SAMHD1-like [Clavelina lepadiformis]|uniref:deoxynucleoside triphosphate triphosphohydrolase SAMHD1-like n=1 Tax=Clavelina lepadiformis TaxID=159417 RepID=UPI0040423D31